jgi:hypothetical protein
MAQDGFKYGGLLNVWDSDDGRAEGWNIEVDDKLAAVLDEPRREEMFWFSYRLTVTTDDAALRERFLSESFWQGDGWKEVVFRSRATGMVAEHAFPAARPFVGPERLNMRGLYIAARAPIWVDRIVLKMRALCHWPTR